MFDYYEPVPAIDCPWCGDDVRVWQGKDGPNALFVWRQGVAHPVDQPVAEESRVDPARYAEFQLPPTFEFTGWCVHDHRVAATGRCVDGTWSSTILDEDDVGQAETE
jgi:hypothetical protein